MTNRIEGEFCATIKGVNLTAASNIQFYVLQANHFFEYKPEVIAPNMVYFKIPYEDAITQGFHAKCSAHGPMSSGSRERQKSSSYRPTNS